MLIIMIKGDLMDIETTPKFYGEIRKIRNSAGLEYSEVIKTVYLYKDKYWLSCQEILEILGRDFEKLNKVLED